MNLPRRISTGNRELAILGGATGVVAVAVLLIVLLTGGGAEDGESAAASTAEGSAEASAAANASAEATAEGAVLGASLAIGETGGTGVSLRSDCTDAARSPGAWAEGTGVTVLQVGAGDCAGWLVVRSGEVASWVREAYLVSGDDSVVASTSGGGATTPSVAATARPASIPSTNPPVVTTPKPAATAKPALPVFEFTSLDGTVMTIAELDGKTKLYGGGDTGFTYLGLVSSSRTAADSICNPVGRYGIITSEWNMRNPETAFGHGPGGSPYHPYFESPHSAYMPEATSPPRITLDGSPVIFVSITPGGTRIHPDLLFAHLGCSF